MIEFVHHSLTLNLSVSTIKVYKAEFSTILHHGYGFNLENRFMSILIRGLENLGHKPVTVYKWDATKAVNFILTASDMSLKFITQETLFLLLVAWGRRISDTLASVRTPHLLKFSPDGQTLIIHYAPGYRFKNDKGPIKPTPITLVRYKEIVQRKEDEFGLANINEKLCPVRAVEQYLHTTRDSKSSFHSLIQEIGIKF